MASMYIRVKKDNSVSSEPKPPETGFAVVSIYNLFCHIYISGCSANSSSQILFSSREEQAILQCGETAKAKS